MAAEPFQTALNLCCRYLLVKGQGLQWNQKEMGDKGTALRHEARSSFRATPPSENRVVRSAPTGPLGDPLPFTGHPCIIVKSEKHIKHFKFL